MNRERSKAPLALMEQIIMILVFALAAAVCLRAFVYANHLSESSAQKELAATRAQTVIEYCKAEAGDLDKVCESLGGERQENGFTVVYPEDGMKTVLRLTEKTEYLQKAAVSVYADDNEVFAADVGWQLKNG